MQKNIWIAAKYLRLSIEDGDKAESESIVNQSILIDNYMKSTSDITIVETFKDDGFSGTDFKRPGFQAIFCARPSAMAVLPTPGSPMRQGLFFWRRLRIWMTRSVSSSRPMMRSSLPSRAFCVRFWQ